MFFVSLHYYFANHTLMSQPIKKTFVVEWQGPFTQEEVDSIINKRKSGCMYLVTGLAHYQRGDSILQYIGISTRGAAVRLHDRGHKCEKVPRECRFWLGHFSNLNQETTRTNLELAEHVLIYHCQPEQNVSKKMNPPHKPAIVINRWLKADGKYRTRRTNPAQQALPDVILYDGDEFWTCDQLKRG